MWQFNMEELLDVHIKAGIFCAHNFIDATIIKIRGGDVARARNYGDIISAGREICTSYIVTIGKLHCLGNGLITRGERSTTGFWAGDLEDQATSKAQCGTLREFDVFIFLLIHICASRCIFVCCAHDSIDATRVHIIRRHVATTRNSGEIIGAGRDIHTDHIVTSRELLIYCNGWNIFLFFLLGLLRGARAAAGGWRIASSTDSAANDCQNNNHQKNDETSWCALFFATMGANFGFCVNF